MLHHTALHYTALQHSDKNVKHNNDLTRPARLRLDGRIPVVCASLCLCMCACACKCICLYAVVSVSVSMSVSVSERACVRVLVCVFLCIHTCAVFTTHIHVHTKHTVHTLHTGTYYQYWAYPTSHIHTRTKSTCRFWSQHAACLQSKNIKKNSIYTHILTCTQHTHKDT